MPPPPEGLLKWLSPVLFMRQDEFVRLAGLDAYMLCRFLLFGIKVFAALTYVAMRRCCGGGGGGGACCPCAGVRSCVGGTYGGG